jgi:hypothetical protein
MKLNKTQARLLTEARRHPLGLVATYSGYFTSRRGSYYGTREANAACALRDAGLIEHVSYTRDVRQLCHRMGAEHGSETVWRITEKGKAQ